VNGEERELIVHRKGATRPAGAGRAVGIIRVMALAGHVVRARVRRVADSASTARAPREESARRRSSPFTGARCEDATRRPRVGSSLSGPRRSARCLLQGHRASDGQSRPTWGGMTGSARFDPKLVKMCQAGGRGGGFNLDFGFRISLEPLAMKQRS